MEDHPDPHDHDHDNDHDHDQNHNVNKTGGSGGPPATPRWNPTKEQINMLESLYRQGIRTPSAEQIQQITGRLRAFGHIEGKNVFYWFQNHKARQRQKQKQESMAYINRFLHRSNPTTQPVFPPTSSHHIPCPNVVCAPYYVPVQTQTEPIGALHHLSNKLPLSIATRTSATASSRRSPRSDKFSQKSRVLSGASGVAYDYVPQDGYTVDGCAINMAKTTTTMMKNNQYLADRNQETLSLFPLSPTGVLQGKDEQDHHDRDRDRDGDQDIAENNIIQTSNYTTTTTSTTCEVGGDQTFYDFFSR